MQRYARKISKFLITTRLIPGVALFFAFAVGLWVLLDWRLAPSDFKEQKETFQLLAQILGGVVILIGLYLTWKRISIAEGNLAITQKTLQVSQDGQITDRFTKAIEQLGAERLQVRLGGIYALERIAKDSNRDHWPIMEVLAAFVRENSPLDQVQLVEKSRAWEGDTGPSRNRDASEVAEERVALGADIQAILTVIARRNTEHEEPSLRLGLYSSNLQKVWLREPLFGRAELSGSDLSGATLAGADLHEAFLVKTNLSEANLIRANLSGAILIEANLHQVMLGRANLQGANLKGANLHEAVLRDSFLRDADLSGADLRDVDLSGADLSRVVGLTREQVESAALYEAAMLPDYLKV